MEETTNILPAHSEPHILEVSSNLLAKVRKIIADVTRLIEDIYRQQSFWREMDRELENREYYRFFFDYMITTPRIGQVPEQPTRMQETCKATFIHRASIIGRLSRLPDRRALPASGTWPTFNTNRSHVMEPLYKK